MTASRNHREHQSVAIRNCFVTGASGFIGRVLCASLQQRGCKVRVLLRRAVDGPWDSVVLGELGDDDLPADMLHDVDAVFHLAGVAHVMSPGKDEDILYKKVNVCGSRMMAEAAIAAGVRKFIFFSSVKAMGDPGDNCVDERWAVLPEDPYGLSKREAERLLLAAGRKTDMSVTVLRPALVYGPGVKGNLFRMLKAIDSKRFPPLPNIANRRSMVCVDDLADAAWLAATCPQSAGEIYIVSDGKEYSTRAMYEWILQALGHQVPAWSVPVWGLRASAVVGDILGKFECRELPLNSAAVRRLLGSACYRPDKIQRELGWQPRRGFREVLPEMVEAFRAL